MVFYRDADIMECGFMRIHFSHYGASHIASGTLYIGYLMDKSFSSALVILLDTIQFREFSAINSVTSATSPFKENAREFRFAGGSL